MHLKTCALTLAALDLPFRAIALLFLRLNTVITMKPTLALALLGILAFAGTASRAKNV